MRIFVTGLLVVYLAVYLALFLPNLARAEPQIEVHLKPSKAIKVGERCHFLVQLTWISKEGDYRFSRPELFLDNLMVEAAGEANETFQKDGEEWKKKLFRFDLKPIRAGKAKIRPFQIAYIEPSQQRGGNFEVEPLELRVFSNSTTLYRISLIITGLLTAVAALGSWVLLTRRRTNHETTQNSEPTLEERTLSRLNANQQQLFEAGKIFRAYLSEKYSLSEGVSTGREILLTVESKVPLDELKTLKRIFDTLEEWQYSASPRPREECERLYSEMVRYVEGKKII